MASEGVSVQRLHLVSQRNNKGKIPNKTVNWAVTRCRSLPLASVARTLRRKRDAQKCTRMRVARNCRSEFAQFWANDDVKKATSDPNNWAMQQGQYAGWRYSELDQVNTSNVKDLKVAWQFSTGVLRGHEGSPIVVGDRMYLNSAFPNNVFALDISDPSGPKILWKYSPKQDPSVIPVMCCDTVNRGVQIAGDTSDPRSG